MCWVFGDTRGGLDGRGQSLSKVMRWAEGERQRLRLDDGRKRDESKGCLVVIWTDRDATFLSSENDCEKRPEATEIDQQDAKCEGHGRGFELCSLWQKRRGGRRAMLDEKFENAVRVDLENDLRVRWVELRFVVVVLTTKKKKKPMGGDDEKKRWGKWDVRQS